MSLKARSAVALNNPHHKSKCTLESVRSEEFFSAAEEKLLLGEILKAQFVLGK